MLIVTALIGAGLFYLKRSKGVESETFEWASERPLEAPSMLDWD